MPFKPDSNDYNLKARRLIGRTYLNEDRLEEALEVFSSILRDYPDDVETLQVMGNLYLAGGDGRNAGKLFRRILELQPDNQAITRQIMLAEMEDQLDPDDSIPTDPKAVARLLQRLTGTSKTVTEADVWKAAALLREILTSPSPADQVARHLDEIDALLPALIELNIRQAQADGRADLAGALRTLQANVALQLGARDASPGKSFSKDPSNRFAAILPQRFNGRVLVLAPEPAGLSGKMDLVASSLADLGCEVEKTSSYLPQADKPRPDVVIASNPHVDPRVLEGMAALTAANVPVIVHLDDDYENMPVSHPDYELLGLGNAGRARAFAAALLLASHVVVPSETLLASMLSAGYSASRIPDGWSRQNVFWQKQPAMRNTLNIGWLGLPGELEDLALIRRAVVRILREFSHTQVVVVGDPQAYRLFESVPEDRRIFLPRIGAEERPYLLTHVDLLVVPLRSTPYHQSVSDAILVEAGAKGIPWIASPMPSFSNWQAGGLLANSLEDWHMNLRQLVMDVDWRRSLSEAGIAAAARREMGTIGCSWLDVIEQVLESRGPDVHGLFPNALIAVGAPR